MTKLLVRTYNEHNDKALLVNPADYTRVVDELSAWLDLTFTIVATDRYTLDAHHEQLRRLHFKLLMDLILYGDNYYMVERQPPDNNDEPTIGD